MPPEILEPTVAPVAAPSVPARRRRKRSREEVATVIETQGAASGRGHRAAGWILALGALLVIAAGVVMRLVLLGAHPHGLFYDEAMYALDAVRVLEGARPIYFPANNGREPLFIYLMAGTIGLFGRTPLGVCAAAAFFGLLALPATYLLGRAWANRRVALLATAILAMTLWHVHLSRIGFRVITLPLFVALALGLGALAFRSRSRWLLIAAGVAYGLSFYTYLACRITPLALLAMAAYGWIWHRPVMRGRGRDLAWTAIPALIVVLPLACYAVAHPDFFFARSGQVAVWSEEISHGDPWGALLRSVGKTLGMFTWRGDWIVRHNVPTRPIFDPMLSVAFLAGVGTAIARWRRCPAAALSLIWVAVMSLPTVMAEDAPHFLRGIGMLPVLVLLPALAIDAGLRRCEAARSPARPWTSDSPAGGGWLRRVHPAMASALVVLVLVGSAGLTARDYFGTRPPTTLRLSGFDHSGCYRTDPQTAIDFHAALTDFALDAATAEGRVFLDASLRKGFPEVQYLLPLSERLTLYPAGKSLPVSTPPFSLFAWPHKGLDEALQVIPTDARITVTPGPGIPYRPDHRLLYVRWMVAPLVAAESKPLARFDHGLALLDLTSERVGDTLQIGLRWRKEPGAKGNLDVHLALVDAAGQILQSLRRPAGSEHYPVERWTSGSEIAHTVDLSLDSIVTGPLRLRLNLEEPRTRARLPIAESRVGEARGSTLILPLRAVKEEMLAPSPS